MPASILFADVKERVAKDDFNKKDISVPISKVNMAKSGELKLGNRTANLNEFAMTQVLNFLDMSRVGYFKKLMDKQPRLVADHVNFWLREKQQETERLFRTRKVGDSYLVRGFVSSDYSIYDNKDTIKSLERILKQLKNYEITNFTLDDKMFHLRVILNDLTICDGKTLTGEKDVLKVGIDIVNSEVGFSSLRVYPIIYRLVCKNGLKAWQQDGEVFEQRHIHLTHAEITNRMNEAIIKSLRLGDEFVEKFIATKQMPLKNPMLVIDALAKQNKYSDKLTDGLKEAFALEPMNNVYGIVNMLTLKAQDLSIEDRLALEKDAGKIVENPNLVLKLAV